MEIVDGSQYLKEIKELIIEYTNYLNRDLSFQNLNQELQDLKAKYTGNHGRLLAALVDGKVVGCVGYYRHHVLRCEMKRLYVKKEYRKFGIGSKLIEQIILAAKKDGYQEMVLDTIKPLQAAINLYQRFGFQEIEPYYDNPMDDVIYMGLIINDNYYLGAMKRFKEYVQNYDLNNDLIRLKVVHSYQVVKHTQYLCNQLNLNDEDRQLALVIALLHDLGRFEQYRIYHSFEDYRTIDHALFSSDLLFKQGLIKEFICNRKYDKLIKAAIEQHNKYQVTKTYTNRELLFIHLIRDSDKLDNFRVKEVESMETLLQTSKENLELETITPVVYKQFMDGKLIYGPTRKTNLDKWISYIAFIFDFHFQASLEYIKQENYLIRLFDRVNPKDKLTAKQYLQLKERALKYVEDKVWKS